MGRQGNNPVPAGDSIDLGLGILIRGAERGLSAGIPSFLYLPFAGGSAKRVLPCNGDAAFSGKCGESYSTARQGSHRPPSGVAVSLTSSFRQQRTCYHQGRSQEY